LTSEKETMNHQSQVSMKEEQSSRKQTISRTPFPNSDKIYVNGSIHPEIKVPMRRIHLSDTTDSFNGKVEKNEPILVYDTSGAYTDPSVAIDVKNGLEPIRKSWIMDRNDVEQLEGLSSAYGRERESNEKLDELRFKRNRKPL